MVVPLTDAADSRKRRGAWYTPDSLVTPMIEWLASSIGPAPSEATQLSIVDPACGDGRLLVAARNRLEQLGWQVELHGCDIDADAVAAARASGVLATAADALDHRWQAGAFDVVIGNPPFLSQMAAETTRGGSSVYGGGPYADTAIEFLALAHRLVRPTSGRLALVLPQSALAARDARSVRAAIDASARLAWSWWTPDQREFDASVNVCVLGWMTPGPSSAPWTSVITDRIGVPPVDLDRLHLDGVVGDRNALNANFRDEYYALVPAVDDHTAGPPLVTSGLIDPCRCWWGQRPVRFAKQRFSAPRVDRSRLHGRFASWAERKLVPKVLIASQTSVIEAVADLHGAWLPGVPVTTATPTTSDAERTVLDTAAVLTSPIASAVAWQHHAGTGLSTKAIRVGPAGISAIPWPGGDLGPARDLIRAGAPVAAIGQAVLDAYGHSDGALTRWWVERLP